MGKRRTERWQHRRLAADYDEPAEPRAPLDIEIVDRDVEAAIADALPELYRPGGARYHSYPKDGVSTLVDGFEDPYANRLGPWLLQREVRMKGHGRSSSGRKTRTKVTSTIVEHAQRDVAEPNAHLPKIRAAVTAGEADYFMHKEVESPGFTRRVLIEHALRLLAGEPLPILERTQRCATRKLIVHAIPDEIVEVYRKARRGEITRALAMQARAIERDRLRIRAIDGRL